MGKFTVLDERRWFSRDRGHHRIRRPLLESRRHDILHSCPLGTALTTVTDLGGHWEIPLRSISDARFPGAFLNCSAYCTAIGF